MRAHSLSLVCLIVRLGLGAPCAGAQVRPGIEVLLTDSARLVVGKRLALLTNQTGVDRAGRRDIDLLRSIPGARLVLILGPEHGIRGTEDRPGLADGVDSATGLPIYSMYGGTPLSAIGALDSVDVVLVDLQDVGARYYSYPATTVVLMAEAARRGKPVVVLDRPNPVAGLLVQGNVATFERVTRVTDFLPVAIRHGMTLGELSLLANDALGIQARLTVVPAVGWRRSMYYDDTGMLWVRPSLNMPDMNSALLYAGTCLFEATNLSVGRGTLVPFQVIAAPWLDTASVLQAWRAAARTGDRLTGIEAVSDTVTPRAPSDGKYDGVKLRAIRLRVTDRGRYDPTRAAVVLLAALRAAQPDSLRFAAERFDRLAGGPDLRRAIQSGVSPATIFQGWDSTLARFREARLKYLLY